MTIYTYPDCYCCQSSSSLVSSSSFITPCCPGWPLTLYAFFVPNCSSSSSSSSSSVSLSSLSSGECNCFAGSSLPLTWNGTTWAGSDVICGSVASMQLACTLPNGGCFGFTLSGTLCGVSFNVGVAACTCEVPYLLFASAVGAQVCCECPIDIVINPGSSSSSFSLSSSSESSISQPMCCDLGDVLYVTFSGGSSSSSSSSSSSFGIIDYYACLNGVVVQLNRVLNSTSNWYGEVRACNDFSPTSNLSVGVHCDIDPMTMFGQLRLNVVCEQESEPGTPDPQPCPDPNDPLLMTWTVRIFSILCGAPSLSPDGIYYTVTLTN